MTRTQGQRPKAFSYLRFSTPEQAAGDSLRRQTEATKRYAAQHGLDLDEKLTFRDLGVSAHHGRNAAVGALAAFLIAVRDGQVPPGSFLLIESLDRISRQVVRKAVRTLEDIAEAGVKIVDLSDGGGRVYSLESLDSDQFSYVMMALRFIRANEESATKGMRVAAAYEKKRAQAAAGTALEAPFTRMLPAWLQWDDKKNAYAVVPGRAALIRKIFEKTSAGWGQHRIAHWLNEQGIKPWGRAKHWHRSYVRKVLTNSAVLGTFTPHKAVKDSSGARRRKPLNPIPDYWPAVIGRDLFERVSNSSAARAPKGRHSNRPAVSIFAGILRCARCGGLVARTSKGKHVYLVCSKAHADAGCKYQAVRYQDVETAVAANASALIWNAPRGGATDELDREIKDLDNAVFAMGEDAGALVDELTIARSESVRTRLRELEASLEAGRERLRTLSDQRDKLGSPFVVKRLERLRAVLSAAPLDVAQANKALKETVERIVLDADRGALTLQWRHSPAPQTINFYSRHAGEFSRV